MKILHLNTYDKGGGAEQFAFDFVHHNFDETIETKLLVKRKKTDSNKVEVLNRPLFSHFLEKTDKGFYKISEHTFFSDLSILKKIHLTFENLQKNEFYQNADIIHLHNIHYDFFDFEDLIKIARQKPIIWTLHDMWAMTGGEAYTFENENFKKGIGKTPYGKFHPLLNPIIDRRQKYLEQKKRIYSIINELKGTEKHNFVFVPVSNWLKECLENSYIYPNKIEEKESANISIQTIQNGIDTTIFKNLNQRNWNIKRILFFNSDNPYKGASIFENLLPQLNQLINQDKTINFELFVVGKEIPKGTINSDSKIKINHLKPIYDRNKMNELYNSVDILIFPSRAENFSLLVLEAMATGVFIIGSMAGGIKEQLANERGILFENENQKDLLEKINLVLNMDLKELREKGKTASLFVNENWNVEKMRVKYIELYQKIL
ncbi:glycosyltransferase [Bernardetia litoralis DSM 6794]|uniref:Glycosyltransferase n=1 Tax=Bernardetia litoralis (strain ATCC 23117 / DSM 6794 / NBRC 15988 / NCIMB 1366 / Fx l1 / Sio-4) TaxID=880071 RepID=I4AI84_BERLS|nr:glycosyltransferase [Bernardetia litoralis]AFM03669.1 glycosyltransferase [Bernardetia litoralis DSM 6794]